MEARKEPSASPGRKGLTAVLAVSAALVLLSLILWVTESRAEADALADWMIQRLPGAPGHPFWRLLSALGFSGNLLFCIGCAFAASRRGDWVVPMGAALLVAGMVGLLLKATLDRERPTGEDGLSWPSGHTLAAFTVAGAVLATRPRIFLLALPLSMGVMTARVVLGRHHVSDVLAGAGIGLSTGVLVAILVPQWARLRAGTLSRAAAAALVTGAWVARHRLGIRMDEFLSAAGGPLLMAALVMFLVRFRGERSP